MNRISCIGCVCKNQPLATNYNTLLNLQHFEYEAPFSFNHKPCITLLNCVVTNVHVIIAHIAASIPMKIITDK